MTVQELLCLCEFTYIDLPPFYRQMLGRGESVPLGNAAKAMLEMDSLQALPCGRLSSDERDALERLLGCSARLIACENRNAGSGFVGYAFETPSGERIAVMRGSERSGSCVPDNIDWRDNFCAPFYGSVQYAEAVLFADRFPQGPLVLTGHSKGAHNALYALGRAQNPDARAIVFNGQGFARMQLNRAEQNRLRTRGVNYVVSDDVVGALLYHPERRQFVRHAGNGAHPHAPAAYLFDDEGAPVAGCRSVKSVAVEIGSRLLLHIYGKDAPGWLLSAVQFIFGGAPECLRPAALPRAGNSVGA